MKRPKRCTGTEISTRSPIPGVEFQIQAMWALTDFTEENGATRIVTDPEVLKGVKNAETEAFEQIDESKVVQAVMPKGSVLFWLQSTIHGGGANKGINASLGLVYLIFIGMVAAGRQPVLNHTKGTSGKFPRECQQTFGLSGSRQVPRDLSG